MFNISWNYKKSEDVFFSGFSYLHRLAMVYLI